eukprot:TRINITY_DN11748_c0_g1_i1.p1 TRINITY_DN11748_c0_g1~~TRINITY_DN11748_c0_g1_i1.p1  ORF type:complete len:235 (+),score=61.13 TRINITY_DN11748_c0_g1_i1:35-706(+)
MNQMNITPFRQHDINHKSSNFSKKTSNRDNWKEDLRNKCINRIKNTRTQMISKLREKKSTTKKQLGELINNEIHNNSFNNLREEEYIELMTILERELLEDLEKEEREILLQYSEQVGSSEDKIWEEDIENYYTMNQNDFVVCPICTKNQLFENRNVIFCKCGFRLNTKFDQIGLGYLGSRLKLLSRQHSENCMENPNFCVNNMGGSSVLSLSCKKCNTFEVVI